MSSALLANIVMTQKAWFTRLDTLTWRFGDVFSPILQPKIASRLGAILQHKGCADTLFVNAASFVDLEQDCFKPAKHALRALKNRLLIFDHPEPDLFRKIDAEFQGINRIVEGDAEAPDSVCYCSARDRQIDFDQLRKTGNEALISSVERCIQECFCLFKDHGQGEWHQLRSTPIEATGYFDGRQIAGNPDQLVLAGTLLSDRLRQLTDSLENSSPNPFEGKELRLLATSRTSISLCAIMDWLTGPAQGIDVIDHYGPWHEVIEEHSLTVEGEAVAHVFVSDFIAGATELKVAHAYTQQYGSQLVAAISLSSVLDPKAYRLPFPLLISTRTLPELVPSAQYRFNIT